MGGAQQPASVYYYNTPPGTPVGSLPGPHRPPVPRGRSDAWTAALSCLHSPAATLCSQGSPTGQTSGPQLQIGSVTCSWPCQGEDGGVPQQLSLLTPPGKAVVATSVWGGLEGLSQPVGRHKSPPSSLFLLVWWRDRSEPLFWLPAEERGFPAGGLGPTGPLMPGLSTAQVSHWRPPQSADRAGAGLGSGEGCHECRAERSKVAGHTIQPLPPSSLLHSPSQPHLG